MANDINISAMSYTNKDFGAIYPEILDLAKELTNRWDPSQSNESDPGVVLLKEAAFVADHNNYNIDKNVLENFLPSATQDRSVRNITEMNGYTPRYYVSANGNVTFNWAGNEEGSTNPEQFTIPAFTMVISDAEETVSYTQVGEIVITGPGRASGRFMEGTLQTLSINDTSTITLENIDDNYRLYLPETMVAQNGIYIKNINDEDYSDYWVRDNYLLTLPTNSRAYKIDYDSYKDLPYIEFPSDISNLIGDGLQIQYISTSGEAGNVSANTLVKILSPTSFIDMQGVERTTDRFTLSNPASITNGKNPETISEMYQSFKKVVGTFDTLVTCRDYSNKIYTLTDFNENPLVSNSYVTDRRTDYNKALNVISYDVNNNTKKFVNLSIKPCRLNFRSGVGYYSELPSTVVNGDIYYVINNDGTHLNGLYVGMNDQWVRTTQINLNDFAILTEAMTPYDLTIYALKAFSMSDYIDLYPWRALNNSFLPIDNDTLDEIKSDIENIKCICHTYNDVETNEVFCFKNYAPLTLLIKPFHKVNLTTRNEILNNIYKALSDNFNPRHIEFGEKLDEDEIKRVILNADSRIQSIESYTPITYSLKAMDINGENHDLNETGDRGYTLLVDLVAKNVLAGRVCLFEFDDEFVYDYGQKDGSLYENIGNVHTELPITLTTDSVDHFKTEEIKKTESERTSTGSNISYIFNAPNLTEGEGSTTRKNLSSGSSYVLIGDDILTLNEIDDEENILGTVTYQSKDNISVTITNGTTGALKNLKSKKPAVLENTGPLNIIIEETISTVKEATLNLDYTLKENEAVQILYPNYYSDYTYSMYVNYRYIGSRNDRIYANTEHTLSGTEMLIFLYTENGVNKQRVVRPGEVVNSSFDIIPTDFLTANATKKSWSDEKTGIYYENVSFKQLASNQTISTRKPLKTIFNTTGIWCYWIINTDSEGLNRLFESGQTERILQSNEYFIYTTSTLDEFIILGTGTKLVRTDNEDYLWTINSNDLTIESITENGTAVNIPWQKNFNFVNNNFTISEMSMVTLGENDNIKITAWDNMSIKEDEKFIINNKFQYCNGNIIYTSNGTQVTLPATENFYQIRSRLDINMSSIEPQQLYVTEGEWSSIQKVLLNGTDLITAEGKDNLFIQSSEAIVAIGDTISFNQKLRFYTYTQETSESRTIRLGNSGGDAERTFYYNNPGTRNYLIPVHISEGSVPITVSVYYMDGDTEVPVTIGDYNNSSIEAAEQLTLISNSSYYINPKLISSNDIQLHIKFVWNNGDTKSNEAIFLGDITIITGINSNIKAGGASLSAILSRINSLISNSDKPSTKPYYPYKPDNSIIMDNLDFQDANTVWDKNNVANMMTIAQIDIENSNIDIVSEMREY